MSAPSVREQHVASVLASLEQTDAQIDQIVADFHPHFSRIARRSREAAVVAMGGSALGADIVRGVTLPTLRHSLTVVRSPHLPAAVRRDTVVIAISYSGTTAETVAAARMAHARGCPLVCIAAGGALATLARRWRVPLGLIDARRNPSEQPRLAVAGLTTALLITLDALGWSRFKTAEQRSVRTAVRGTWKRHGPAAPVARRPLARLARQLATRFILAIASDRYWGNAHVLANQLNENAKTFAAPFALPELDHHLLEGLRFPKAAHAAAAVFLRGAGDEDLHPRFQLTAEVFRRHRLPVATLQPLGTTVLAQSFSLLLQTGLLSAELAAIHRIDPVPIPWVNFFKHELARRTQ